MNWLILVGIRIFLGDVIAKVIQKKLAESKCRERALAWQYFLCAAFSWILFLVFGKDFSQLMKDIQIFGFILPIILIIVGIGLLNGFACYCQWRSQAISMSKASLMGIPDDIIALTLIYLVSPELEMPFLTPGLIIGVVLCFVAAAIFAFQKSAKEHLGLKLLGWVLGYTIIWGIASFLFRFFAGGVKLPWHNFLLVWYNASLVSTLIILGITRLSGKPGPKMTIREKMHTLVLTILVLSGLGLYYIALKFGPLTAIKPIFLVSAIIGPTLVGFIVFKEHKSLAKLTFVFMGNKITIPIEKIAYILGAIGVAVIALNFPYKLLS